VQFGYRRQNSQQNKRPPQSQRPRPAQAFSLDAPAPDSAPKSAARLAAEAAFAAPEFRAEEQQAVPITTRQVRWTDAPGHAEGPEPDQQQQSQQDQAPEANPQPFESDPNTPPAARAPRVFRVETTPKPPSDDALAAATALPSEDALQNRGGTSPFAPKTRRKASHRQPGPVVHVVHAPAVQNEAEEDRPRLDLMRAELARIAAVLDEAKRAESLQFVAPNFAWEWERIWRKGEGICRDIKGLWR
jgi:hypothetical protein